MRNTRHSFRKWLTALCAVGCVLLCLTGCQPSGVDASLALSLSREPRQLDPQVSDDAASVELCVALFEGLTRLEEDGSVHAGAASRWTVSDDGLTYTFYLRDAKWSDETPVTAADFVYGIRRAADPATGSPLTDALRGIRGADAVLSGKKEPSDLGVIARDEKTLMIRLTAPDPAFLEKLALPPFFPCNQTFFEQSKGHYGLEKDYVLGNGAFTLSYWDHGTSLTLKRRDTYWDVHAILPATIRYKIMSGSGLPSLLGEAVDAAPLADSAEAQTAREEGLTVVTLEDTLYGLWFNSGVAPLDQAAVRTALRDAVEWETVYRDLPAALRCAEGYVVPDSLLADGSTYRTQENAHTLTTQSDAAKRWTAALGETPVSQLTLLCAEEDVAIARDIVQSWQKNLTVYFGLETVPAETLDARLKTGNYELALGSLTPNGDSASDLLACFATDAVYGNYARFSDKTCNTAIRAASANTRAAVQKAETALYTVCPMVPIAFSCTYYGVAETVQELTVRPFYGGGHGAVFGYRMARKIEK